MPFEWDEAKRLGNIEKHGIDFIRAQRIFDGPVLVRRLAYGDEDRWIAIGLVDVREIAVVYTIRGEAIRIISARRARGNEREAYQASHQG
jgi:uncharacterized protein